MESSPSASTNASWCGEPANSRDGSDNDNDNGCGGAHARSRCGSPSSYNQETAIHRDSMRDGALDAPFQVSTMNSVGADNEDKRGEEQVCVSGTSMGQPASLVHAQSMDGFWCFVCFPMGPYFCGCYRQTAFNQDSFMMKGCCFMWIFPVCPFTETWERLPGTNKFFKLDNHKKKDMGEFGYGDRGFACSGCIARCRIGEGPPPNQVQPLQVQPLPLREVQSRAPAAPPRDTAAMALIPKAVAHGNLVQLRCSDAQLVKSQLGDYLGRGVSIIKMHRGFTKARNAHYNVGQLSNSCGPNPITFRVDGGADSCFLWVHGDPEQKQLTLVHGHATENNHVCVWNDVQFKPGFSRWIFHDDGTVSPDPSTCSDKTRAFAHSFVIGYHSREKHARLVKRGDKNAWRLTVIKVENEGERRESEAQREREAHESKKQDEEEERRRLAAQLEMERQNHANKEAEMREALERREAEMQGKLKEERRRYEEAKKQQERDKLALKAELQDAKSPGLHTAVNMVAGAISNQIQMFKESKYATIRLILGSPERSDLKECVGLEDPFEFGELMKNPLKAMKQEWLANGSEDDLANFDYVVKGTVEPDEFPGHVKESLRTGVYHGGKIEDGEFDTGHDGMDLKDFSNHESSRAAGLQDHHVAAIRLYTSSSYPLYNQPMREGKSPHPIRVTMYCLAEGLKMLRKVGAKMDPEGYAKTKYLWRGMKDREIDLEVFKVRGGTELAPMSTTSSREVADSYAGVGQEGHTSLLFRYTTKALSRGVLIDYLSMYPKEKEYLYPPLTSLTYDERSAIEVEGNVTVVPVDPQMA